MALAHPERLLGSSVDQLIQRTLSAYFESEASLSAKERNLVLALIGRWNALYARLLNHFERDDLSLEAEGIRRELSISTVFERSKSGDGRCPSNGAIAQVAFSLTQRCRRKCMAISETDLKLLWGRAAGLCSNPQCKKDLTAVLIDRKNYNIGEMAHIIARSVDGPRGQKMPGPDSYDNLILLCPTCHTIVDKDPGGHPKELALASMERRS